MLTPVLIVLGHAVALLAAMSIGDNLLWTLQVLHVLGHRIFDPPDGSLYFPLHSHGVAQHCGGQWTGHVGAAVLHPAGWICHHQAVHPPLGRLVSPHHTIIFCRADCQW